MTLISKHLLPIGTQHVILCVFRKTGFNSSVANSYRIIHVLKFKPNPCVVDGVTDFKCKNQNVPAVAKGKTAVGS